ncbi:MAG: DUF559 domain-containing protein [Rhodoblastus sp.]|nr:DUF559 domain-containing protein [Rhodoblastus sp.]
MRGPQPAKTKRARTLRAAAPSAESLLWSRLRARRLGGFKFVRQEPIGPYFADFCCREAKLVVEVDGATHSTEAELARDAAREAFLISRGYRVLRFRNVEVYEELDGVMETVLAALEGRTTL